MPNSVNTQNPNIISQSNESLNSSQSYNMNDNGPVNEVTNHVDEKNFNKNKNKKVLGIGFGNIFLGNKIELKTKENFNSSNGNGDKAINQPNKQATTTTATIAPASTFAGDKARKKIKAKVLFDYAPTQPDELKLTTGEIIYIIDKHLEDEGWWRGESIVTGRVGVFPDNFVEEILESLSSAATESTLSTSGVPVTVVNGANASKRKPAAQQLHSNSNSVINTNGNNMQTNSTTHIM